MRIRTRWSMSMARAGRWSAGALIAGWLAAGCAEPRDDDDGGATGTGGAASSSSSGVGAGGAGGAGGSNGNAGGGSSGSGAGGGAAECDDGATRTCYGGPPGTRDVGVCHGGTQGCESGAWGPCTGELTPSEEACDGLDNNCDGQIDEGDPGGGLACSTSQPGACAAGTTACAGGQLTCDPDAQPSPETCDGIDDDCNGIADEGCPELSVLSITTTAGGKVVSDLGEIDCRGSCQSVYMAPGATSLTLSAVSDAGFQFVGWAGGCAGTGACAVSMSASSPDVSLTAMFAPTGLTYDACPTQNTGPTGGGSTTLESIVDMVVLCDGWMLYVERTNNRLVLRNVIDGTLSQSFQLTSIPRDVALDRTHGLAYVAYTNTQTLTRVDLTTGEVRHLWIGATTESIAVSDEGVVFLRSGSGSSVRTLDGTTSDLIGVHSLLGSALDYNDATDRLITSTTNYFYDHATDTFTAQGPSAGGGSGSDCTRVYVSPDGDHAARPCGGGNGSGYTIHDFYSHDPGVTFGEWATGAYPSGAAFSPNSQYALLTNRTQLQLFSVATHALLASYPGSNCSYSDLRKLGVSLDSRYLIGITQCGFNSDQSVVTWRYHDTSM